jgi:hypothetical protein
MNPIFNLTQYSNYSLPVENSHDVDSEGIGIGVCLGALALGILGLVGYQLKKRKMAAAVREKEPLCNMLREKLQLTVSDFSQGEGQEFCIMVKELLRRFTNQMNERSGVFSLESCDETMKQEIIGVIANTLTSRNLVIESPRQMQNCYQGHCITNNKEILNQSDQILQTVELKLQGSASLIRFLDSGCDREMVTNPAHIRHISQSKGLEVYLDKPTRHSRGKSMQISVLKADIEKASNLLIAKMGIKTMHTYSKGDLSTAIANVFKTIKSKNNFDDYQAAQYVEKNLSAVATMVQEELKANINNKPQFLAIQSEPVSIEEIV